MNTIEKNIHIIPIEEALTEEAVENLLKYQSKGYSALGQGIAFELKNKKIPEFIFEIKTRFTDTLNLISNSNNNTINYFKAENLGQMFRVKIITETMKTEKEFTEREIDFFNNQQIKTAKELIEISITDESSTEIKEKRKQLINEIKKNLVSEFKKGNIKFYEIEAETCQNTGMRINFGFSQWETEALHFRKENNSYEEITEELMKQFNFDEIQEIKVSVPSGKLLISDWFRHPAFTNKTETKKSIESKDGIIFRTKKLAELGIATVYVGNTCPSIYEKDGNIICGSDHYEEDETENEIEKKETKMIITDLWWVTMVDKTILEKMLVDELGEEKAKKELNKILKDTNVVQKEIPPGEYYLYFTADNEKFAEKTKNQKEINIHLNKINEPMFYFSQQPLFLEKEMKNKKISKIK